MEGLFNSPPNQHQPPAAILNGGNGGPYSARGNQFAKRDVAVFGPGERSPVLSPSLRECRTWAQALPSADTYFWSSAGPSTATYTHYYVMAGHIGEELNLVDFLKTAKPSNLKPRQYSRYTVICIPCFGNRTNFMHAACYSQMESQCVRSIHPSWVSPNVPGFNTVQHFSHLSKPHPPLCWLESCRVQRYQRCWGPAASPQKERAPALAHSAGMPSVFQQTACEEPVHRHLFCTASSHTPEEGDSNGTAVLTANDKARKWGSGLSHLLQYKVV